jgi:transposase
MSQLGQSGVHRDVAIILSLPGVGRIVAATMLAEASQALAQRDYHALRNYSGSAPITRQSGKKKVVLMRQSCNQRMRNALYHWARVSVQCDDHSREHYAQLRRVGHKHGRALRGVADRLLPVLVAMLKSGTLYDPQRRTNYLTPTIESQTA